MFEVPISQLQKPPRESRLLREPTLHLLKENMKRYSTGPGAAPLVILCRDVTQPDEFQEMYKNVYKHEILGGLHTFKQNLSLHTKFQIMITTSVANCWQLP